MVAAGSMVPDALLMLLGAVSHVGFPAIDRMAQRQAAHELIADLLGDDAGSGYGDAVCIPIHQCFVGVAELREWQAIDEDLPGIESARDTRMARRMAMAVATRILKRSISRTEAAATAMRRARSRIGE